MIPDVPNAQSVADIVQQRAKTQPDFEILTYLADGETDERPLTYAAFDRQAQLVAGYLQAQGLKGERVLLLFPQGLEYMIALFGCFYAGVIAVPAYPPRNNRNLLRLVAIMENCEAAAIVTDQSGKEYMRKMEHDFSAYPIYAYESVIAAGKSWQPHRIEGEDIAYLQYTSGSTGDPKGVVIRHNNMVANAVQCQRTYTSEMQCAVNWIPMYHDMGLMSMMSYLLRNAKCYFMAPVHFVQRPLRWLEAVSRYKAQFTLGPNFAFDLCCEKITPEQAAELDLSSLQSVTSGSERVRLSTMQRFHERFKSVGFHIDRFAPSYGLAEATLIVSTVGAYHAPRIVHKADMKKMIRPEEGLETVTDATDYHVSNGPPVDGATLVAVDAEKGQALLEGQEGEIWIHFDSSLSTGYWGKKEASQATFYNYLPDAPSKRYMRTGDLGFILDGEVFITGRIKDMIIIRGANYYPQDIEYVVSQSDPALQENSCAAFYLDQQGEEQLVIVQEVRRAEWRAADPDEGVQAIRTAVSDTFEIAPQQIVLIFPMSLPKTSSGKIQRRATKQQLLEGKLRVMKAWEMPAEDTAAQTAQADLVVKTSSSILQWLRYRVASRARIPLEDVPGEAAFQDFPLESVDAAELSEDLSEELGISVEAESFWAMPTLQALAEHLYEQYQAAKA